MKRCRLCATCGMMAALGLLLVWALPAQASSAAPVAYIGPGAGLSMLAALAAVFGVIGLGLLGPILYPLVWIKQWCSQRHNMRSIPPGNK